MSSSLAAILIAAVPLLVALMALRFDEGERAHGRRLVGLVVGFAGVVALVGLDVAGNAGELLGAGAILLAATGYAAGPMLLKRHLADIEPVPMMGAATGMAALILTPAALLAPPESTPPTEAIGALLVLGLLCTATAFVLFGALVTEVGPGRATVITYVAPGRGGGPGRGGAGRAPGRGRRGGTAADHRRLLALHRRPRAAGPGRGGGPHGTKAPGTRRGARAADVHGVGRGLSL